MNDLSNFKETKSDHDLLITINTQLGILLKSFEDHRKNSMRDIAGLKESKMSKDDFLIKEKDYAVEKKDTEMRVRRLERMGSIGIGVIGFAQFLIAVFK